MKKIALIGSTGSIGVQTLNVCRRHPDKFKIVSLAAGNNQSLFCEQVREFMPTVATLSKHVQCALPNGVEFWCGQNAFTRAIVEQADIVVIALVGFNGILAVLDAIEKGKNIALANKESLVVGGELVTRLAREKGVSIVPIDSEHSAIWQALDFDFNKPFKKLILTASGGAFRDFDIEKLATVTAKDALKHPNWAMGDKITVDCATLVNKAFEVIEAKWLYKTDFDKVSVIIHRESIIHSMVEFEDNSVIAQMGLPSMELPIQTALSYPNRLPSGVQGLNLAKVGKLTFEELEEQKYPCFNLILQAAKRGGTFPAVANGANDRAVDLFLKEKIGFLDIYRGIKYALDCYEGAYPLSKQGIIDANAFAVSKVNELFGV